LKKHSAINKDIMYLYRVIHGSSVPCVNLSHARELAWHSKISINDLKPVWEEEEELSFILPEYSGYGPIYYFILPDIIADSPQYYHITQMNRCRWDSCDQYAVPLINGFITKFKKESS
jgi:hypothetical protein